MTLLNQKINANLSSYFSSKPLYLDEPNLKKPNVRKLAEQPWQQTKAALWDEVTNSLCNLDFIQAKAVAKMTYALVREINQVLEVIPDNAAHIREKKTQQARLDKYTQDLIDCASGKIPLEELEIIESITPWTEEQKKVELERINTNPNRADRLKDFLLFLGQEAYNLQAYADEFVHFTHQQAWNFTDEGPVGKAAHELPIAARKTLLLRSPKTRPPWNPMPQALKTFSGHTHSVNAVAITPDGRTAISGSDDKSCVVWDVTSGQVIQTLKGHTWGVNAVAITPDGKRAISGSSDETCIVWDLTNGQALKTFKGHYGSVYSVAIIPDGRTVISGSDDKSCVVWDVTSGQVIQTLKGHTLGISAVAITPDGKLAISGSWDKTCKIWDLLNGLILQTLKDTSYVKAVAITPDGKRAISGSMDGTCKLWDLQSGIAIKTLSADNEAILTVSITSDAKWAISGLTNNSCILWDLEKGQKIKTLAGHSSKVKAIAITSDGKKAISGAEDNTLILWDIERGPVVKLVSRQSWGSAISIFPDGKRALSCNWDKTSILWELNTGKTIKMLSGHTFSVGSVLITPDGKRALSHDLSNKCDTCVLWDIETGRTIKTLSKHTSFVTALSISPDGKRAITGSNDTTCILWDLETGQKLKSFPEYAGVETVLFTPDGKRAISGTAGSYILWDLETGKMVSNFYGLGLRSSCGTITPDGRIAFLISILRDLGSGRVIKTFSGDNNSITAVSITPDGKKAILGSNNKTCILLDIETAEKLSIVSTNAAVSSVKIFPNGFVVINSNTEFVILKVAKELICTGPPVVTIRRIWDFEFQRYQELSADGPYCGHRFAPPTSVLKTIEGITKKYKLQPHQSPCLDLPEAAWEEPGLLGDCPECGDRLKFNPFIAGGD